MEKAKGVICWLDESGTFGYIAEDERRHSKLYLHASTISPTVPLKVRQRVSYDRVEGSLSGVEARNVVLATEEQLVQQKKPGPIEKLLKLLPDTLYGEAKQA